MLYNKVKNDYSREICFVVIQIDPILSILFQFLFVYIIRLSQLHLLKPKLLLKPKIIKILFKKTFTRVQVSILCSVCILAHFVRVWVD